MLIQATPIGDPKAGTPLMKRYLSLAMELPLKALIWESEDGKVWISYNRPEFLRARHGLDMLPFEKVGRLLPRANFVWSSRRTRGRLLGACGGSERWSVSPDESNEVLCLVFEKDFGLLLNMSGDVGRN